jgi:plasmid maintenance system antidote protein VapI
VFDKGEAMPGQILKIEELKDVSVEEVVRQLVDRRDSLTILVSDDEEISMELKPRLKPLPVLEGRIPDGWKEAISPISNC